MLNDKGSIHIRKLLLGLFVLAVITIVLMWNVGINDNGFRTVVQWPTGKTFVKFSPGFYFTAFGTAITYKDAGTYAFGEAIGESKSIASLTTPPVSVTYNDGGKGTVSGIVRWDLPDEETSMLELHRKYRSPEGVAHNLVAQTVQESMNLTAALMSSEEAYAEKREVYRTWARIQTEKGSFATQQETKCDTTAAGTTECREIASIRRDEDGKIIHSSTSPLKGYFVTTPQFQVKHWDFEENTLQQISKKREATMAIITAKADAERAKQEAITAEEEGKAKVMTAKYEKEVEKIKEVVTAEKIAAVAVIDAEKKVDLAAQLKLEKEQDKFAAAHEKQAAILRGEGEAEARRLKMAADNALEQKLATYEKVSGMYADAIAQQKWVPEVQFGGNTGSGGTGSGAQALIDMFTAKTAKDIALDMKLEATQIDGQ